MPHGPKGQGRSKYFFHRVNVIIFKQENVRVNPKGGCCQQEDPYWMAKSST